MNELCLCEVAEIHLVVSNMDFYAGRSLMSLHLFSFCVCVCALLPNYVRESNFCLFGAYGFLCMCFRCMSCVASSWGCQWNTEDHTCSDSDSMVGSIIKHRQVHLAHDKLVPC